MKKIRFEPLQKYITKVVLFISILFVLWVAFTHYQSVNESILNPPAVEQTQLSAREAKVNEITLENVNEFHNLKTKAGPPKQLENDPFKQIDLDITLE